MICWGWGQRGKGDLSSFPTTELRRLDLRSSEGCGFTFSQLVALRWVAVELTGIPAGVGSRENNKWGYKG